MGSTSSKDSWPEWVCPEDHRVLSIEQDRLRCPLGHEYPVVHGIPRFVLTTTYAENFGAQWNQYRRTQLDSYTGMPISRDRLRRCLGEGVWQDLSGKLVLECGCGAGRFTEILLERGARLVSIDLSDAVEANAQNFPPGDSHRIAQADLLELPFEGNQFDVVVCLGVVQHTPSPERAIQALARQLAPGGSVVFDHYTDQFGWYTRTAALFRVVVKRLPAPNAMALTERLVRLLFPLHKAAARRRLARRILHRLSPLMCYFDSLPQLSDDLQYEWALVDTHDTLTDWYRHFRSKDEIRQILRDAGILNVWCEYGGNGVEARGQARQVVAMAATA